MATVRKMLHLLILVLTDCLLFLSYQLSVELATVVALRFSSLRLYIISLKASPYTLFSAGTNPGAFGRVAMQHVFPPAPT